MPDEISNEPVIASTPAPISVEPRTVSPVEVAEVARQAEEARIKADEPAVPAAKVKEPVAAEKAPRTAKEAIRAAREKIEAGPATPLKVAAKETPAPEKVAPVAAAAKDAKAEPVAAVAKDAKAAEPAPAAQPRAEDGKFAPKAADPAVPAADAKAAPEPAKPSHTASPPPARFSQAAKDRWAEAPEEVRAETERAVSELTKGFEKHRAAAERDAGLVEFHEMAGKSGKALRDVVAQYVGMENLLRKDPVAGLELIAKNAGLSLRDVAAKVLGQTPDAAASAADQRVIALEKELAEIKTGLGTLHQERTQAKTDTTTEAVTKFASDPAHSRFDELADDIAFFLKTRCPGDLAQAYTLAERLNPAPAAPTPVASAAPAAVALPKPTLVPAPASAAPGDKSITGSLTAGSDPVDKVRSNSIKEALQRAKARAG
jgi:hypothetical protein